MRTWWNDEVRSESIVFVDVGGRLLIGLLFHLSMRCFEALEKIAQIVQSTGTKFQRGPANTEASYQRAAADPSADSVFGKETIHDDASVVRTDGAIPDDHQAVHTDEYGLHYSSETTK